MKYDIFLLFFLECHARVQIISTFYQLLLYFQNIDKKSAVCLRYKNLYDISWYINGSFSHVPYTMGAIASVLQWHCTFCSLINPTERKKCIRCGTPRQSLNDSNLPFSESNFDSNSSCTVIRRARSPKKDLVKR